MKRIGGNWSGVVYFLALAGLNACGSADVSRANGDESVSEATPTLMDRLRAVNADLARGAQGDGVRAVQEYLSKFGYLPNQDLAARFPAWRPLVTSSPTLGLYDETTAAAVRLLQANAGIPDTGIVDAATRTLLVSARCGVPEGIASLDASDKFAQAGSKWSSGSVTWKVLNTNDVTLAQARSAVAAAFASWTAQTSFTATEITSSATADIQIQFAAIDGAGGILAQTFFPASGGDMTIDTAETWSVASPTPSGQFDLQTIVLHELGHAIGLHHSSLTAATMYPFASSGTQDRTLDVDDDVGVSSLYDTWEVLPGLAKDIGVGANGTAWVIGTNAVPGGFGIYKWNGSNWDGSDGGAVRIAVDPTGIPWVLNSAGNIFRRTTNSPTSGSWTLMPGLANDIGIGNDGSVWVIGTNSVPGGFGIYKWNGSSWVGSDGGAVRIAVGPTGVPWVVNSAGNIFRRTTNSPTSGTWPVLPGLAKDIGIGQGNYAWVIGTNSVAGGFGIYVWDEQSQVLYSDGSVAAPAKATWLGVPGGAVQVSVGPGGRPWVVNSAGNIFRSVK